MRKRLLAMSMAVLMLLGLFPTSAFAVEGDDVVYGTYVDGVWTEGTGTGTYTDEDTGVTLSKTAEATGNPNEYEVTLQVVTSTTETTTPPGAAATVLVIDVSGSMKYCAECGSSASKDGAYYHAADCELSTGTTTIGGGRGQPSITVGSAVQSDETRLYAAKAAAISFLDSYKGTTSGTGRYVSVVKFSTNASVAQEWVDVSTEKGYSQAESAINGLSANGGTNLERGLYTANSQLTQDAVKSISADAKNVIVLTDGIPTYYGEGSGKNNTPAGPGSIGCPDVNEATAATAAELQKNATVYTVCFGAAGQKCWNDTDDCKGCDEEHNASDAPTVDAFLSGSVASSSDKAYDADNTDGLNEAFEAITETITSGLTGNGMTVTDPMGEGVTADIDDLVSVVTDDSDGTGFTWDLSKTEPVVATSGSVTTYTYTITYTVTIDPTEIEGFDENTYYPLNRETTLTIPGKEENIVLNFEVPGVKGVLPTYTVIYNRGDHGTLADEDESGQVVHENVKHGTATPDAPAVTPESGYYFTGWAPEIANTVTEDVTYTAQYTQQGAVTVTGKTDSVTYDGKAHDLNEYDVVGLNEGYTLTVTYTGANGTDAGTYTGAFSGTVKITDKDGTDVTYKYAVKLNPGKLTIDKRAITITADSDTKIYDTDPLTKNSYQITAGSRADRQEIASVTITGIQTEVGESDNVPSDAKIVDAGGNDVTANYAITYVNGKLTVTPDDKASIEVQAYSGVYDGQNHEGITSLTLKNGKDQVISTDGWTITYIYDGNTYNSNPQFKDAGTYPIVVSATNDNYGTVTAASVSAVITARPLTLTSPTRQKVYDGTALTTLPSEMTISSGENEGFVGEEGVDITMTGSQLDKGTSSNTFKYVLKENTKASNYDITVVEGTLTVTPVTEPIIITANSDTKEYGGTALTNSGYTYTQNIIISTDTLTAVVTGSQTNAGSSANVVTSYKVMRGSTDVTANYTFGETVDGLLTVTKKAVTMTSPNASKTYDGTPLTTLASDVTVTGFVGGEGVDITMTGSQTDVGTSSNEFTYTLNEGTNADNYVITETYGILTVNKATASMTVNGYTGMYDGAGHSVTPIIAENSYVAGNEWTVTYSTDGGETYSAENPAYQDVGEYTVLVKATSPNYNDLTGSAVVKITKRDVTLTSGTSSRPYDGTPLSNPNVTVSGSGFVDGEGVSYSDFPSIIDEGSIDNTFKYELNANTKASNYDITVVEGTLTVTKASDKLVITANSNSKTYDGSALTDPGYSANTDKLITGDVLSVTVEGTITDAGEEDNVVTEVKIMRGDEDVTRNYDYETVDGTLTVNPKAITLTSGSSSKPYDGTPLTNSTVTDNKFVPGEGASYDVTGSQTDKGSSDNKFTYALNDNTKADNYVIEIVFGTLTVTPATGEIVVTANSASKTYDGEALTDGGYTVSGQLAEGDELTATVEGSQLDAGSSGNEVTEVTIMRGDKDVTANYANVKTVLGTLTVTPRSVTLTSASDSKTFDGLPLTNDKVEVSGDGFVEGEGATYDVTGSQTIAGTSKNTFTYTLNENTKEGNYNITKTEGDLTVFQSDSTEAGLSAAGYTGKYDGQAHDGVTAVAVVNVVEGLEWTYTYSTDGENYTDEMPQFTDAGEYTVYVKASNPNYEDLTATATVTITPRSVTLTSASDSKVLDGTALTNATVTVSGDGFVEGEGAAYDVTGSQTEVGSSENKFTYTLNDNTKAANYEIETVFGTLTVYAKGLKVEKTVDKTQAKVGDTLVYTITVTNTGDVELTNITVTDPMLNVEKNIGTLAPGAVWSESFTYEVQSADAGKTIVNTAVAQAEDGTKGEGSSPSTEIEKPSSGGGGGSTVLNTKDHYSYIIGYQDGTVRPYGTITRGEVATIFFRLLTDEARDKYWSQDSGYSDCGPDLWCNNAISTLSNMGIISGYSDGTFRPYAKITRAQFAKIAVGFFETTTQEYAGYYSDVPEDAWYTDYVEAASRVGLIQGFQDGTFRPNENITRAQACVIVNRALNRTPDKDRLLPVAEMITWPDCTPDDWFYADIQEATNSHDYTMITVKGEKVEKWSEKLPQRDWAAFEHAWSTAHSAPGGEVVK